MKKKQIAVIIAILAIIGLLFYFNTASAPKINTEVPQEESPSAQKIDINAVCEGALAYMSFTDGASAEVFVQECKEGKHPEVIEQYKANLNIDNDAAI